MDFAKLISVSEQAWENDPELRQAATEEVALAREELPSFSNLQLKAVFLYFSRFFDELYQTTGSSPVFFPPDLFRDFANTMSSAAVLVHKENVSS